MEHASPVVVAVLASVPEHVVTVVHEVEQVSDSDDDTETVEQKVEQVFTGDAEHELEDEADEEPDAPSEEAPEVGEGEPVSVIVFGWISGTRSGGPMGGLTGLCINELPIV